MKTIEGYLRLPYHIVLIRDEDENGQAGYVAEVQELPGCLSQGSTPDEAYDSVRDAMYGWIKVALEDGKPIPGPVADLEFSGRILVRCPKTLHASLSRAADCEGVSLNQFVVSALASAVDWRSAVTSASSASSPAARRP